MDNKKSMWRKEKLEKEKDTMDEIQNFSCDY